MTDISEIRSFVFTRIEHDKEIQSLKKEYPDFTLTTSPASSKPTDFPTLLLQSLDSPEVGQDLDNTTINAINAGFQIDVIDNEKNRERVNAIMRQVRRIMKSMRFNLHDAPDMDTNDEKRSILRATRIIGSGDTL